MTAMPFLPASFPPMASIKVSGLSIWMFRLFLFSFLLHYSLSKVENDGECSDCGIWLAKSTIEGGGIGLFAGRAFEKDEDLLESGDIVIPIIDFDKNQPKYRYKFLWDDYTWTSDGTLMTNEGLIEVNAASPGFGSCANSYLDLQNVEEWRPDVDYAGLDRNKDPGAGAYSAYHNRRSTAKIHIAPYQELFVSYGNDWFEHRAYTLGAVPLSGDHRRGQVFLEKYRRMQKQFGNETEILKDAWEQFVWQSPYKNESRLLNALPATWEDMEFAMSKSLLDMRKKKHTVTQEWLEENGRCADNIRIDKSTIPQAGRGAFATRFLRKGSVVSPMPLIHLPHKARMEMYSYEHEIKNNKTVFTFFHDLGPDNIQLLWNYCFSHANSTILLCPYGVLTAAINHNQTRANLMLQWGDPKRTGHHPDWFELPVMSLIKQKKAGLAFEVVATRDIEAGEELLLDYGNEWEEAWKHHVQNWEQPDGDWAIPSIDVLNANKEKNIRTVYEIIHDPYPTDIITKCELCFQWKHKWKKYLGNHTALVEYIRDQDEQQQECEVLRRDKINGTVLYTAYLIEKDSNGRKVTASKMEGIPIEAFVFAGEPYTSDMHLPGAFRHTMMIPDEMFPEKWKNELHVNKEESEKDDEGEGRNEAEK